MPPAAAIALPETAAPAITSSSSELDEMIGMATARAAAAFGVAVSEFRPGSPWRHESTKETSGRRLAELYEAQRVALRAGMSNEDFLRKARRHGERVFQRESGGIVDGEYIAIMVDAALAILTKTVTAMMN